MTAIPRHAIILFAHGSRDPAWRVPIEAVAARMRELQPQALVRCAYLELTAPDLATVMHEVHEAGARAATIWPLFFGAGRHVREDLPRLAAQLRTNFPAMRISVQAPIAENAQVLEVMARTALLSAQNQEQPV
ncbi:sirohydrochlorin chelatase [Ottowia sp.]|uniref:sirohydrochlorin chelatase n=1 Tax=Ottowia sp. TaxID=1898956 RepID=UPI003A8B2C49